MTPSLGLADKVVRLDRALRRGSIDHAFGGALALAYYATPRATIDIDVNVFVSTDNSEPVAKILARIGVRDVPPHEVIVREGQFRSWWEKTPLDVFFSYDEVHEAMRRDARTVPFGDTTIPILAPEHLLVAKAVFDRPKDWIDIEQTLLTVHDLDLGEARRWLEHLVGANDPRARRFERIAKDAR